MLPSVGGIGRNEVFQRGVIARDARTTQIRTLGPEVALAQGNIVPIGRAVWVRAQFQGLKGAAYAKKRIYPAYFISHRPIVEFLIRIGRQLLYQWKTRVGANERVVQLAEQPDGVHT